MVSDTSIIFAVVRRKTKRKESGKGEGEDDGRKKAGEREEGGSRPSEHVDGDMFCS